MSIDVDSSKDTERLRLFVDCCRSRAAMRCRRSCSSCFLFGTSVKSGFWTASCVCASGDMTTTADTMDVSREKYGVFIAYMCKQSIIHAGMASMQPVIRVAQEAWGVSHLMVYPTLATHASVCESQTCHVLRKRQVQRTQLP